MRRSTDNYSHQVRTNFRFDEDLHVDVLPPAESSLALFRPLVDLFKQKYPNIHDNHAWTVIVDLHFKMADICFLASFASWVRLGPCSLVIQNFKMAGNKRETENRINKYYSYVELLFFLLFMPVVNGGMK